MRILMISMFSNHFFNWTEQLRNSGHEIFWIDVFDSNTKVKKIEFVHQIIGWRYRIRFPGRYLLKQHAPKINRLFNYVNERDLASFVEKKIALIKPDVVQSFVMYSGCVPILEVMKRHQDIKWIYSAWGNDLYYYQNEPEKLRDMKKTLPYLNYMFADCTRDYILAKELGFEGNYLGTFPGGGGYELQKYSHWVNPILSRKKIIIKGYQGKLGRCNTILRAISTIHPNLSEYEVVVFGANDEVETYAREIGLSSWNNFMVLGKIAHEEVLELMGEARIYIGNCISDGTPNTMLESIIMGAFPIQSNPGGATAELIEHGRNGLLIENPENWEEIKNLILDALNHDKILIEGIEFNNSFLRPYLEREYVKKQVLEKYKLVETEL